MRILVTGGCGFAGAAICRQLVEAIEGVVLVAFDNLRRLGSEGNVSALRACGVKVVHGDVRCQSDIDAIGPVDWVIDAAAEASVLAGTNSLSGRGVSTRQLVEHNLIGSVNLLELASRYGAGFILLSTSRVYSIPRLVALEIVEKGDAFSIDPARVVSHGLSPEGITEDFSTNGPVSLYGATKLASEALAIDYAEQRRTPLYINRCGVLAGAGQFGRADQGIFSWWIHSWAAKRPLGYIGFGGRGLQVRDCLHPYDLARLVITQIRSVSDETSVLVNVSGGMASATSLAQLSAWCRDRFGAHVLSASESSRPNDVPWVVLDHGKASQLHGWIPEIASFDIFEEIARHAVIYPDWLDRVAV